MGPIAENVRASQNGSKFDETFTRSINGGKSMSLQRPSRNIGLPADVSPRISFAKQAQIDFMNNKYLGQQASAPFGDKQQSSIFMTEPS